MTTNNLYNISNLKSAYQTYLEGRTDTIDEFKSFLQNRGFETTHADYLYSNINKTSIGFKNPDFEIKSKNPKAERWVKKFLIPFGLGAATTAVTNIVISNAMLKAGTTALGLFKITTSPYMNFIYSLFPIATIGGLATAGFFYGVDFFTKLHYKVQYGTDKSNVKDMQDGVSIENLKITKLIEKIERTNLQLVEKRGNALTRWFKRKVNRNRIHHLEACIHTWMDKLAEGLFRLNAEPTKAGKQEILAEIMPIYELLKASNNMIIDDVQQSIMHELLTCTDRSASHEHLGMVENLDIYANLQMYLKAAETATSEKTLKKTYKEHRENPRIKKEEAREILITPTGLIGNMVAKYEKAEQKVEAAKEIVSVVDYVDGPNSGVKITFSDGTEMFIEGISTSGNTFEVVGKKVVVTNEDGTTTEYPIPTKKRIDIRIAAETKMLESLEDTDTINQLLTEGFTADQIEELKAEFKKRLKKKVPKPLQGTPTFKNYKEIYTALNRIVAAKGFTV